MTPCAKRPHATRAKALAHLKRLKRELDYADGRVYWCHACDGWHVGHTKRWSSDGERRQRRAGR